MRAARIVDGRIVELFGASKADLTTKFAPGLLATFEDVPDGARLYQVRDAGGAWVDPPAPEVTASDIKDACGARITARYPLWKQSNIALEGGPQLAVMQAWIKAMRARSNELERTLPQDYNKDHHWPPVPADAESGPAVEDWVSELVVYLLGTNRLRPDAKQALANFVASAIALQPETPKG